MRRKRQELPKEECEKILKNATAGVLSVLGDGGYPYGVPMSFVYAEGKLYFHSAVEGHKLDAIVKEDKCSFTVIDQDEIHPDEYTTYFRSVIAFGRIHRIESMEDLIHGKLKEFPDHADGHGETEGYHGQIEWRQIDVFALLI